MQLPDDIHGEWIIEDDAMAEWAVNTITKAKADYTKWKTFYQQQTEKAKADCDYTCEIMYRKLQDYFGKVPHKETATTIKYTLPDAQLVLNKPKRVWEHDDEKLLSWLQSHGRADCVKFEMSVRWAEAKKQFVEVDGVVCDIDTGEIVEAVTSKEQPAEFKIVLKD